MRVASQSELVNLVHGLLQGAGMDGLAELVNVLLRKRRAEMGHLFVAWVSSGRRRSRVKSLRLSLEDPKLKVLLTLYLDACYIQVRATGKMST